MSLKKEVNNYLKISSTFFACFDNQFLYSSATKQVKAQVQYEIIWLPQNIAINNVPIGRLI